MVWQHAISWLLPQHLQPKEPPDLEYLQHLDYEPDPGNTGEQMKAAMGG